MNRKKSKSTNILNSSMNKRKKELILALQPLCNDITWMEELINFIKNNPFPDNDKEYLGLTRKISYILCKEFPNLLDQDNPNTHSFKILTESYHNQPVEKSNENILQQAKKISNEINLENVNNKKPSKQR